MSKLDQIKQKLEDLSNEETKEEQSVSDFQFGENPKVFEFSITGQDLGKDYELADPDSGSLIISTTDPETFVEKFKDFLL